MLPPRVRSVCPVVSKPSNTVVNEGLILTTGFPQLVPLWLSLRGCLNDARKRGQWKAKRGGKAAYLGLCSLTWTATINTSFVIAWCISFMELWGLWAAQCCTNASVKSAPLCCQCSSPTGVAVAHPADSHGGAAGAPGTSGRFSALGKLAELAPNLNSVLLGWAIGHEASPQRSTLVRFLKCLCLVWHMSSGNCFIFLYTTFT